MDIVDELLEISRNDSSDPIDKAISEITRLRAQSQHEADCAEAYKAEAASLRDELERERMRLAACGVVALANTPDAAKEARQMHEDYWSASVSDVARMVDEQIRLRGENAKLLADAAESQARSRRMAELMRKLREHDWHIESIRAFRRELHELEIAAVTDDSVLREMIEAARRYEREAIARMVETEMDRWNAVDVEGWASYIRSGGRK